MKNVVLQYSTYVFPVKPKIFYLVTLAKGSSALLGSCLSVIRPSSVVVNFPYFQLLQNHWTEFNKTWKEAKSQRPLPSLCFSGWSEEQDGRPGLWLAEACLTSPLEPLNEIQRNLTGNKISTSSTKFVFFGPIRRARWPSWPLIGLDIFGFSSETTKRNSPREGPGCWVENVSSVSPAWS